MLAEALTMPFFQRALCAGLLASIACGIIGTFVVVKRISSISGGVAHAALGGVGIGYFCGFNPVLGAFGVAVLSGLTIGRAYLREFESLDTLIAMVWSFGMAIGILLVSLVPGYAPNLNDYMFGSIVFVPRDYLLLIGFLDLLIVGTMWLCFTYFQAIAFDEEFSTVQGVNVERYFLLLLVLISLAVVTLMKVVGIIMVIALLTIPAVIARTWTTSLGGMMLVSVIVSAICTTVGLFASYAFSAKFAVNVPCGPLIILVCILLFCISRLATRVYTERK